VTKSGVRLLNEVFQQLDGLVTGTAGK